MLIESETLKAALIFNDKTGEITVPNMREVFRVIDSQPPFNPWHRVKEEPRDGQECIVAYLGPTDWIYEHATYHSDLNKALEEDIFIEGTDGFIVDGDVGYARHGTFNYWMPIEPPKEDA